MERLLEDASKLSGVEYNIDNLGDVYDAIHVIQEDLGLTGVAAQEASETFSGSMAAMKAAGENLMANLVLGEDIGPSLQVLSDTIQAFVFNNLFPMIGNLLEGLPELLSGLSSILIGSLNIVANNADQMVQLGLDIIVGLVSAIVEAAPYLVEAAFGIIAALGNALINTDWASIGSNLLSNLRSSIDVAAGEILGADTTTISSFLSSITSGFGDVLATGSEILLELINGILSSLPELITTASELLNEFTTFFLDNAMTLMESGVNLILDVVSGILESLPEITSAAQEAISTFLTTLADHLPDILTQGGELLLELALGLIEALPDLVISVLEIIGTIVTTLDDYDWLEIGKNILLGIKDGLLSMLDALADAILQIGDFIWDSICDYFGISSPSKLAAEAGKYIDEGWAIGLEKNADLVTDAISDISDDAAMQLQTSPTISQSSSYGIESTESRLDRLIGLMEQYLPGIGGQVNVVLEGDAEGLFNVMQDQNKIYKRMNGESAFA